MIRYCKQLDQYSCGPIALLNALKWKGHKVTYKTHIKQLSKLSKCRYPFGTNRGCLNNAIHQYFDDIEVKIYPNLKDIEKALTTKFVILLYHVKGEDNAHYCALTRATKKKVYALNLYTDEPHLYITKQKLKEMLHHWKKGLHRYPVAWFLS